jgi:ribonuclease-3
MNGPLSVLEGRIGHVFGDPALLAEAVTHRSFLNENPGSGLSNQRLEFLGDAVLQLILTEELFRRYPGEREGVLSKRRAALAKGEFLAKLAVEVGLDAVIRFGAAEAASGGRRKATALEDALEATVGAVYLDSDLAEARRVVLALYGDFETRLTGIDQENPKGRLQERVQPEHGNSAIRYEVTAIAGEDHAREYEVAVFLLDRQIGSGRGPSKKAAEENAARAALSELGS